MAETPAALLIASLGQDVGIPELRLDEAGCCTLAFDGSPVHFELDEDTEQLLLHTELGAAPPGAPASFFKELLGANLAWMKTAGATLSLDRDGGDRVILMQALSMRLSGTEFVAAVERFVDAAEAWAARVGEAVGAEAPAAADHGTAERPFLISPTRLA